jgi:hypothetical protein
MVADIARKALKKGMKAWILTTERLQAGLAQLREELDDVVAEARHEHEQRVEGAADQQLASIPDAEVKAAKPKVSRTRGSDAGTPRRAKTTKVAV